MEEVLNDFKNKSILVLGIGEEGIDTLSFFKENVSYKKIGVADALPYEKIDVKAKKHLRGDVELHLGEDYLSAVKKYDVVVKSPGVPSSLVKTKKGQKLTSQSDIFLSASRDSTIGVTGTKGKSTTCMLLYNLLLKAGYSAELVGNIGTPALSFLSENKKKIFIYELSSFQLETVNCSPWLAVILNIFPDHLDKHKTFRDYVKAKEKITLFQGEEDVLVYNKEDKEVANIGKKTKAKTFPFSPVHVVDNIATPLDPLFKVAAALKIDTKLIDEVVGEFKGLPHRVEYFENYQGIDFYNDSAATIPEATLRAIESVENLQTVIVGGVDKGGDYRELLKKLKEDERIRNIVVFRGTPESFTRQLTQSNKLVFPAASMKEAVDYCAGNTSRGSACLLSPGFASFNMFKNYKERGDLFKSYVRALNE